MHVEMSVLSKEREIAKYKDFSEGDWSVQIRFTERWRTFPGKWFSNEEIGTNTTSLGERMIGVFRCLCKV